MTYKAVDAATVRLRWLSLEGYAERYIPSWRGVLDDEEIARADRFRSPADRNTFIAAHALARTMLSAATGMPPRSFRYVTGPYGKPAIAPCPSGGAHFNISHTRGLVACAVARHFELGLDVEVLEQWRADFDIVCRLFSPDEMKLVKEASPDSRANLFFRLWTLKESFVKATGEGFSRPLNSFSFRFDPLRIDFHPRRDNGPGCMDTDSRIDVARWQFVEYRPAPHRMLALTVFPEQEKLVLIDASPIRPEEIGIDLRTL